MARGFRIHSGAVFNPFTYQELRVPLDDYKQAYEQMQDYMLTAGEEANQYNQIIGSDEYASGILKGYNDTLSDISGQLSREGLKAINRNTLIGLRRRYNSEVKPINDAAKTLLTLQDSYRQASMNNPSLMRGVMPSIKDLVENPGATPLVVNGQDLYKQGAQAAQSASSRIYNSEFGDKIDGYIKAVQAQGYTPELMNAFMQDISAIPELAGDIQRIRQMYQTGNLEDRGFRADQFIMQGILDGAAYQEKVAYERDWQKAMAMQFSYQQAAANAAAQRQQDLAVLKAQLKGNGSGSGSGVSYNTQLKKPLYIRDGQVSSASSLSPSAFEEALRTQRLHISSIQDLSLENKVNALIAIGVDRGDLIDGYTEEIDENRVNNAILANLGWLNQYNFYENTNTGKRDPFGNRIPNKERLKQGEFLMEPKAVIRDTSGYMGYDDAYGSSALGADYDFDADLIL